MAKLPIDAEASKQSIFSQVGYGKPPQHSQIASEVGYGKPPKQTRFQKGQSGNPLGRPKKSKPKTADILPPPGRHAADMHKVLCEAVRLKENGRVREVSKAEALQRKTEQMALTGRSVHLMRDLRKQLLAEDARILKVIEDDHVCWSDYRKNYQSISDRIARTDPLLREWLPAPEDITSPPGQLSRYRGAVTTDEAKNLEHLRRLRDALIAQVTFDIRTAPLSRLKDPDSPDLSVIPYLIVSLNLLFPARIVRQGEHYWDELSRLSDYPTSHLHREVARVWGVLGYSPTSALSKIPFEAIRAKVERVLMAATA